MKSSTCRSKRVYDGVHFLPSDPASPPGARIRPGDIEEQRPADHHAGRKNSRPPFRAHPGPAARPIWSQGEPLQINGQLTRFHHHTYTDITERKAAEEGLRAQHDLLQTVIESIPSAVSLFDKDQQLVLHNQELLRLLDLPPALLAQGPVTLEAIFRFNAERGEYGPGDPEDIVPS